MQISIQYTGYSFELLIHLDAFLVFSNGRSWARPSRDIVFRNIVIGSGHGISVGSETAGGAQNITFVNITMTGTERGPRIKSERGRGGVVDGVKFINITARNLDTMISVTQNYQSGIPPTNTSATPILRNVLFDNVRFLYDDEVNEKARNAGSFDG